MRLEINFVSCHYFYKNNTDNRWKFCNSNCWLFWMAVFIIIIDGLVWTEILRIVLDLLIFSLQIWPSICYFSFVHHHSLILWQTTTKNKKISQKKVDHQSIVMLVIFFGGQAWRTYHTTNTFGSWRFFLPTFLFFLHFAKIYGLTIAECLTDWYIHTRLNVYYCVLG